MANETKAYGSITITDVTDGKSAYELWLEQGNEGTEEEYLASLKGDTGRGIDQEITLYYAVQSTSGTPKTPQTPDEQPESASHWVEKIPSQWKPPLFGKDTYIFTTVKKRWNDGGVTYTPPVLMSQIEAATMAARDSEKTLAEWCAENNVTIIDGSTIATGTITADKIDVNDLLVNETFSVAIAGKRNYFKGFGVEEIELYNYNNRGSFSQFNDQLTFNPAETVGQYYTISMYAKSPNGETPLYIYNSNEAHPRHFHFSETLTENLGAEWQYVKCTIQNTDRGEGYSDQNCNRIEIYAPNQMGVLVKKIKVEVGKEESPWTPAPEDGFDHVVTSINASPSGVVISGDKVQIIGNTTFKSLSDAFNGVTATEGNETVIDGGKIKTDSITSKQISVDKLSALSSNIGEINAGTIDAQNMTINNLKASSIVSGTIDAEKITIDNIDAGNIKTGYLSADRIEGKTITGDKIAANTIKAGNIDAEAITAEKLSTDAITSRNYYEKNDEGEYVKDENGQLIKSGQGSQLNLVDGTWDSAYFKINEGGEITATGGNIGGWTINTNSLTKENFGENNSIHLYPAGYTTNNASESNKYFGQADNKKWMFTIGSNFGVDSEGKLYATGGKIGGLEILSIKNTIDQTSADAKEAKDNAQKAAGSADDAQERAANAETSALTAQSKAEQAKKDAEDAAKDAAAARADADDALSSVEKAEAEATKAAESANSADKRATSAEAQATQANTKAANAIEQSASAAQTAQRAEETANTAVPKKVTTGDYTWLFDPNEGIIMNSGGAEVFRVGQKDNVSGLYMKGNGEFTGTITATEGNIGGWKITYNTDIGNLEKSITNDNVKLYSYFPDNSSVTVGNQSSDSWRILAGSSGVYKFGVDSAGTLYATGANISGTITASTITGSTFTNDSKSFKIDSDGNITGSKITGSSIEIKEGNTTNFSVTNIGELTANKGSIAGWTINPDSLTKGDFSASGIHLYPAGYETKDASTSKTYFGQTKNKTWMLGIGSNFGVDSSGNLYATGGNIAGWKIDSNSLTKGTFGTDGIHLYSQEHYAPEAFGEKNENWMLGIGRYFGVTKDGYLYANAGQIGGLEIGKIASKQDVDNIEIGGRNLYTGTAQFSGDSWRNLSDWTDKNDVDEYGNKIVEKTQWGGIHQRVRASAGEQYTLSATVFGDEKCNAWFFVTEYNIGLDTPISQNSYQVKIYEPSQLSENGTRVFATYKVKQDCDLAFRIENSAENSKIRISSLKLEKGNKATAWTPAPEDQVSSNVDNAFSWKFSPTEGMYMWNGEQGTGAVVGETINGQTVTEETQDKNLVFKIDHNQVFMRGNGRFTGEVYADKGTFSGDLANSTIEDITQFWWKFQPGSGITFWNSDPDNENNSALFSIDSNGVSIRDLYMDTIQCNKIAVGNTTVLEFNTAGKGEDSVKKTIRMQTAGENLQVIFTLNKAATKEMTMMLSLKYYYKDALAYDFDEMYTLKIPIGRSYVSAVYPYKKEAKAFLVTQTYKITNINFVTEGMDALVETNWTAIKNNSRTTEVEVTQPSSGQLQLLTSGHFIPTTEATETATGIVGQNIGDGDHLWANIFAKNPEINISDANVKRDIQTPSEKYEKMYNLLRPVTFKFIEGMGDRTHNGFIAQEVKAAMDFSGITPMELSAYCEWDKKDGTKGYGLRYSEFITLNTWQIQKLKPRMASAEEKLLVYESRISALEKEIENLKKS